MPSLASTALHWVYSELLPGFDALDPLRTTAAPLPEVGAINGHCLVTGSTIRAFYGAGGT